MRLVLHDLSERFLNLERGWLRTVRELTFAPGPMIRRYVNGRRRIYANPFPYLVVATAASLVVQRLVGFSERVVATAQASTMESPLQAEFVNRFSELMLKNSLYLSIGILVPMALLIRVFFCRSGYNLAETFVFSLYAVGHTALLGCVLVPFYMLLPQSAVIQAIGSVAVVMLYVVFAARGFFPGGFFLVAIKTAVAYLIAYAVFMAVMMVCTLAYIMIVLVPTSSRVGWDLVTAADYGATPALEKLLDEGADVNMTMRRTALHAAAENGDLEIVDVLLEHGAGVNLQDIHGRVPMFVALGTHQLEVARRLADAGTDPGVRTTDGGTLLTEAVRTEDVGLVTWALKHGIDVNATRPKKKHATALIIAAGAGNAELVKLLLANGADPTVTNHRGLTALDFAKGRDVKELLRKAAERPQADDSSIGVE